MMDLMSALQTISRMLLDDPPSRSSYRAHEVEQDFASVVDVVDAVLPCEAMVEVTPRSLTIFSNLIVTSLVFRMTSSVGICLLRYKRFATVLLIEILKPHSWKKFSVAVRYRWTSLDKADRFGPDFHIELQSANLDAV